MGEAYNYSEFEVGDILHSLSSSGDWLITKRGQDERMREYIDISCKSQGRELHNYTSYWNKSDWELIKSKIKSWKAKLNV